MYATLFVWIRTVLCDVKGEERKSNFRETIAQKIFETKKDKLSEEFREFHYQDLCKAHLVWSR